MSIPCDKTSVGTKFKVVSQGQCQISRSQFLEKMAVAGELVFHKHSLFLLIFQLHLYEFKKFQDLEMFVKRHLSHVSNIYIILC